MTKLTPLANALHRKVWPFVMHRAQECETIAEENAFMNCEVPRLAPHLANTPVIVLACVWGIHPDEATIWRDEIRIALRQA